jgi:hypothetical protein
MGVYDMYGAEDYPTGAVLLLTIAGILEILSGIVLGVSLFYGGGFSFTHSLPYPFSSVMEADEFYFLAVIFFLGSGYMMLQAVGELKSGNPRFVRSGAIMALVASIIGLNILAFLGAILAFKWRPAPREMFLLPPPF